LHLKKFTEEHPSLPCEPEPIEAFLTKIPGRRYRWNHYVTLRTFYNWVEKRQSLPNPMPRVESPKNHLTAPYYLEPEDVVKLLNHPDHPDRDRALLWLLADTGMRIGEAHSISASSLKDDIVIVDGKTGTRFVPVSPIVIGMLKAIAEEGKKYVGGTIWLGPQGPLRLDTLGKVVRKAFKRAGFRGALMSAHRLRHTFATLWEGSETEGRAIGGWKTPQMWQRYHHLRIIRMITEHQRYSPLSLLRIADPKAASSSLAERAKFERMVRLMVKSRDRRFWFSPEELAYIRRQLMENGHSEEESKRVVNAIQPPPKPITIEAAAKKKQCSWERIRKWVQRGHLDKIGVQRNGQPGRRRVLIDEHELDALIANPPKTGRPKKRRTKR